MSNQPFMQLYVADYLADTMELSTVEHGAYLLLLMTMWRHGAKLPNDQKKLARIARLSPTKFKPVWDEISRFFVVDGDVVTNRRLLKEHQKAKEKSEIRATAGKAGGDAKALKDKEARLANANDLPCHSSEVRDQIEGESDKSLLSDRSDQTPEDRPKADDLQPAIDAFNTAAAQAGWPAVQKLTPQRKAALKARLADVGGIDGWVSALERARASPHLCGQNDRGWMASFDFLTRQSSFAKLMEGNYDPRSSNPRFGSPRSSQPARDRQPAGLVGAAMRGRAGSEF